MDVILTPAGHLHWEDGDNNEVAVKDAWTATAAQAFAAGSAAGLFALAATRPKTPPAPVLAYWRDFACQYLSQLCRTPEFSVSRLEPLAPPAPAQLATLLLIAPPMSGGEYLSAEILSSLWRDLDEWVRRQVADAGGNLAEWLKQHAGMWHQVGRVCFHLAENKRDPDNPFAFLATYAPKLSQKGKLQYQPLGHALTQYAGQGNKKVLINLLAPVQRAAEKSSFVKDLVDSGEIFHPQAWAPAEAYRLLQEVPLLVESGLLVRLPDWWHQRPRAVVKVTIGQNRTAVFGADALMDFSVELALGEQQITPNEWRQLLKNQDGLVFLKGQWVEINREKLAQTLEHWKKVEIQAGADGISFIEGMRLLAGAPADLADVSQNGDRPWALVKAGSWLSETLENLRQPEKIGCIQPGPDFQGTLRPYQQTGQKWLWFLSSLGLGACLADDMGLGKTVQVLALLAALKAENRKPHKPSLLVLPASLLANWKAEIRRFAPGLRACFVHSSEIGPETAAPDKLPQEAAKCDLILTTYGMLSRKKWLLEQKWRLAILDEAQAIKNPGANQTRAVKQIQAEARIALTGTPVENRLSDLWSIFDYLCPGLLGSANRFKQFVKSLERQPQDRYAPLRNLVAPYILRRLKTDKSVIADLPDKIEMKTYCGLSPRQAALYAGSVKELARGLEGLDGIARRGLVLSFLMRFKQICNHPAQVHGYGEYDPAASGKFQRLRSICEEIASRQEKALVFSQFREITEPLAAFLAAVFGGEGLVLHGGTPVKKRRELIEAFQAEAGPPFLVLSLKAGGTGLNLTAASHVIHFDRWWNPAVENQATDRAFRIGQHRNVLVHKFICRGTVEEKIDQLIDDKVGLSDSILSGGGESLLTEMSNEELLKVVALDIERAEL